MGQGSSARQQARQQSRAARQSSKAGQQGRAAGKGAGRSSKAGQQDSRKVQTTNNSISEIQSSSSNYGGVQPTANNFISEVDIKFHTIF